MSINDQLRATIYRTLKAIELANGDILTDTLWADEITTVVDDLNGALGLLDAESIEPYGIACALDIIKGPNIVDEKAVEFRLPTAPLGGEAFAYGTRKFKIHGRAHMMDEAGGYLLRLLVEEVGIPAANLVAAAASALDQLKAAEQRRGGAPSGLILR